jgi:stage V sporulation protein B
MSNGRLMEAGTEEPTVPLTEFDAKARPAEAVANVQRIVRNSTMNLVAQGLFAVFHLAVILILTRLLSKDELGEYFTLFAWIVVIQLLVEAGTTTVLTRRIAQHPERLHETIAEVTGLCLFIALGSVAVFVILGGAYDWYHGDHRLGPAYLAAGFACAGIQVQRFCGGVFRAFECFRPENIAKIAQGLAFCLLVTGLIVAGWADLTMVLAMLAVSHLLAAVYITIKLYRRWGPTGCRLRPAVLAGWLRESVPLGFGDVIRGLTWQLDTLLLALLQPAAVVAIYSVAYRPLGPLNWLPRAVLAAAFPAFARLATNDGDRGAGLDRAFGHSVRLLWVISVPIAVSVCCCAEPLVRILGGDDYLEAAVPMRMLIWITVLSFVSIQFRFLFTAMGRQRLFARLVVLVFLIEAVLQLLLIPHWGYFGACAGSLVGEAAFTAMGLLVCRWLKVGNFAWGALARAVLAGALMAVPLWFVRELPLPLLIAAVILATAFYFALCVLFGALRWEESQRLVHAIAGFFRPANAERTIAEPRSSGGASYAPGASLAAAAQKESAL